MNVIVEWLNEIFRNIPMVFLEVWGRVSFFLGIALIALVFGRFTFRCGDRWGFGRERQSWDAKALLSMPLTIVLVIGFGILGSQIVIVPGAQTLESLKDVCVFLCVVLFGYPAILAVVPAYMLSDLIEGVPLSVVLSWTPLYLYIPCFHWVAYQLFGKNPDFKKPRVLALYSAYVLFFMLTHAQAAGYACGPMSGRRGRSRRRYQPG